MHSEDANPTLGLLKTVFESILQVFILCFAGWIVARKGILDKKIQKTINKLNVFLFTPALLFSKVAFFLTPAKLKQLWIIPIVFCVVTLVSVIVSWTLSRIFRLKRSQRAFAIAASMFMNSNSLPIALMQSMVGVVPSLKWGKDDRRDAMLGRALTYLVLYSTLGLMLRWSYGVHLLAQADDEIVSDVEETPEDERPLLGAFEDNRNYSSIASPSQITISPSTSEEEISDTRPSNTRKATNTLHPPQRRRTGDINPNSHFFYSFPNTPHTSHTNLPNGEDDITEVFKSKFHKFFSKINEFMTPPMWAALASLLVACIRPIQYFLEVHVPPVKGALTQAGNCSIPLTLIVLGGYFYADGEGVSTDLPQNIRRATTDNFEGDLETANNLSRPTSEATLVGTWGRAWKNIKHKFDQPKNQVQLRKGETATVFVAVVSRMILTPLVLMPVVALLAKYGTTRLLDDPVFVVCNVLLISSPPALTLAQITQAASGDAFERLLSKTIFWSYCVMTPPLTLLYVFLGLRLAQL